jgi:chromosome segregation ATPase
LKPSRRTFRRLRHRRLQHLWKAVEQNSLVSRARTLFGNVVALAPRIEEFGNNLSAVRQHIHDAERQGEALRFNVRQAADNSAREAAAKLKEQQSAHDALVKEAASAKAQFEVAHQQCEPERLHRLQHEADGLTGIEVAATSVTDATARLELAKSDASDASSRVSVLQDQLRTIRPKVAQLVSAVGEDPSDARRKAEAHLAQIDEQLHAIEPARREVTSADAEALTNAQQRRAELEAQVEIEGRALESATLAQSEAERVVGGLKTEIASKHGELKAIDRVALEAKRLAALDDAAFQVPDSEDIPLAVAVEDLEGVKRKLEECDGRLNAAKGQLHLVAGHVGAERLVQQEEAVKYASDEMVDRERTEMAALRPLNEIQSVEAARASHLGRTLGGPITEAFRALTGGRYGQLGLDPDLKTRDIAAVGAARDVSDLSVGTREQLATLIRVAIAGHLQTALILDDQLVHSDPERLNWFRQQLRASAGEHGHQVIVLTCRPADYVVTQPEVSGSTVSVVDLGAAISRSTP